MSSSPRSLRGCRLRVLSAIISLSVRLVPSRSIAVKSNFNGLIEAPFKGDRNEGIAAGRENAANWTGANANKTSTGENIVNYFNVLTMIVFCELSFAAKVGGCHAQIVQNCLEHRPKLHGANKRYRSYLFSNGCLALWGREERNMTLPATATIGSQ